MRNTPLVSSGILVGNAFPLSLVRRRVLIEPVASTDFAAASAGKTIYSFWGHSNTLAAASRFLDVDLTPTTARPALVCDSATGLPSFEGRLFRECWVLAPEYVAGFRPVVGVEVPASSIIGWRILRLHWEEA